MTKKEIRNIPASIRVRLKKYADEQKIDFTGVLVQFCTNRFLYRLSISDNANNFVLKGSLLFVAWYPQPYRPTKDADLLGFGSDDNVVLSNIFKSLCDIEFDEDGLTFEQSSVRLDEIRAGDDYGGKRVTLQASLNGANVPIQIDIGFGDIVTPEPTEITLPALLNLPEVRLKAYPKESVIAEKTEALVKLGIANGRLKDFSDLYVLAGSDKFEGTLLSRAISATFARRKTALPSKPPVGLTSEFYSDPDKIIQWNAFRKRIPSLADLEFRAVGERLMRFLLPPLLNGSFQATWLPQKGWH
jgi:Nucleotidyl transferase AbiEii toxin, Type IV TA system